MGTPSVTIPCLRTVVGTSCWYLWSVQHGAWSHGRQVANAVWFWFSVISLYTVYRQAWPWTSMFSLQSAGIRDACHHAWLSVLLLLAIFTGSCSISPCPETPGRLSMPCSLWEVIGGFQECDMLRSTFLGDRKTTQRWQTLLYWRDGVLISVPAWGSSQMPVYIASGGPIPSSSHEYLYSLACAHTWTDTHK